MADIPQWAFDKAAQLARRIGVDQCWLNSHRAFAAYIASKEEPPVDVVLQAARELSESFWPGEGALKGKLDHGAWTERLVKAIRRGMELAKEPAK